MLFQFQRFVEKRILPIGCTILSFFKRKKPIDKDMVRKVLFLRFWALGEAILVLPAIKAFKEEKPGISVEVLCTNRVSDVFYGQEFIDRCNVISAWMLPAYLLGNLWRYDVVIDTEPHFAISAISAFFLGKRSIGYNFGERAKLYDINVEYNDKQHAVFTICDLLTPLGVRVKPDGLVKLKYDEEAKRAIQLRFEANNIDERKGPIIGVAAFCGSSFSIRAWPGERYAKLIGMIKKKYDCIVILTGTGKEAEWNEEIIRSLEDKNYVYNFSNLPKDSIFYLFEKYSLMISNDSGPMHVAAAQGVPTIGLFGPNTPERFGPFPPDKNIAIYHKLHEPVINVHTYHIKTGGCDGECMRSITVDEVFAAADKILGAGLERKTR